MIDFRYHLVSIVSIFFALAVGIVLGAGPLQSNIGTTLGEQVVQLRTEKQELRDSLDETERTVTAGQEYAEAVTDRVVSGRLADRSAVVVAMPDADTDLVEAVQGVVGTSGATVTGIVDLTEDWFDPELADERAVVAQEAATALGLASTSTGDVLLREVLAKVVVSPDAEEASVSRTAALG